MLCTKAEIKINLICLHFLDTFVFDTVSFLALKVSFQCPSSVFAYFLPVVSSSENEKMHVGCTVAPLSADYSLAAHHLVTY